MASTSGPENLAIARRDLEDRLFAEPYCFEFVQAVRLLRRFYPNRSGVGLFQSPSSEVVRFGAHASLAFPASEIQELEERPGLPALMRVNFMGAIGPLGLLPLYYTELAAERVRERDRTLRDFLDIFQHRMISLFYGAWRKYRFQVAYEEGEGDEFSRYLMDVVGLGLPSLQGRQAIDDYSLLYYSGLLSQHPRSAEGLELLLADYFGIAVKVEQFLGAWYRLDEDAQCELDDSFSDSRQLGFGTVVGDEIWDPQSRVRVVLGPLALREYLDFLPSGSAYVPLRTLVRFYASDEFDFEAQLILRREETPGCELGGEGESAPQLGWLSWSKTADLEQNPAQTILQL